MKRRTFLRNTALASSAAFVPKYLTSAFEQKYLDQSQRKLVVIQLSGGNDGLNTVVPHVDDLYYKARPSLAWDPSEVIKIHDHFGLNPGLEALRDLFEQGHWSIINNVGYPNPDRSHFRSMDIWHTASGSDKYLKTGWLGRYLDHSCSGTCNAHQAIEIGDELSLALKGNERDGFVVDNIESLKMSTMNPHTEMRAMIEGENENLDYLFKVLTETKQSAEYLLEKSKVYSSKVTYPLGKFGHDLKQVAELINSDNSSVVYYLDLTGFDTHVFQKNKQKRLLRTYAEGLAAFMDDLKKTGKLDDVLVMTFSEFGRRVKENASGGTDHGTANNVFLMGTSLKRAGLYMNSTDLEDLDNGDLKYKIDFRQVYSEVLENWLGVSKGGIIKGGFKSLGVV